MGVVLPTMQPDQYRLVSAAGTQPVIVQGQPGTGKTVIAAHRAVYLTSNERGDDRVARIAIVGPSDHYVEHVTPLISKLKEPAAEIRVLSLPAMLRSIVGLRAQPKPGPIGWIESSWDRSNDRRFREGHAQSTQDRSDRPAGSPRDRGDDWGRRIDGPRRRAARVAASSPKLGCDVRTDRAICRCSRPWPSPSIHERPATGSVT